MASDLERDDWRTFRLDRMTPRVPTGPRFDPRGLPGSDVLTFVAARFRGSVDGVEWPWRGEVVLALPLADIAPYIAEGILSTEGPDRTRLVLGS